MENTFAEQLRGVIDEYDGFLRQSEYSDASDVLEDRDIARIQTRALAVIERITGTGSVYFKQAQFKIDNDISHTAGRLQEIIGIAQSLLSDIEGGYLGSLAEIIHSDLFVDYLEMAQHLIEKGYKDAAAVIAGSTLEAHLRQLASKHNVDIESENGKSKKADTLNADLVKVKAYGRLDQKNITAWLDLRNKAAHGEYDGYNQEQVELLLENIRNYIARNPA